MGRLLAQVVAFIGFSGIGWLLDFAVFLLLGCFSANIALNNVFSSWVGVSFVFYFATSRIFVDNGRIALRWKYLLYLVYQMALIFFLSHLLTLFKSGIEGLGSVFLFPYAAALAKVLITPVSMVLNFLIMRFLLEKL